MTEGARVAGRYLLEAALGAPGPGRTWRALDERLGRRVALRLFDPTLDRDLVERRVSLAAGLAHPHIVRIFDSGWDDDRFFVACELVPGSLAWARLPLGPAETIDLGVQVASALAHAHERGVAHGGLHAGNVLLYEQGAKLSDFCLSSGALVQDPQPSEDLRALGALLYRCATGRDQGARAKEGKPFPKHPPELARIVGKLTDAAYASAPAAAADLKAARARVSRARGGLRRRLAAAVAVAIVALGFAVAGASLRDTGQQADGPPARVTGARIDVASVEDHDPFGDHRENRATVARVADGDPSTYWTTERYTGSPDFSGLKGGVGVIFDLGAEEIVGGARVLLVRPGCSFELRHSPTRSHRHDDWSVVASEHDAGPDTELVFPAATSRWWLLWITRLTEGVPGIRGGYACGVAEVEFFAA